MKQLAAILPLLLLLLMGCSPKDLDFDLPPYESQLVLESYLEGGKKPKVLVTRSASYYEAPNEIPLVYDALVTLTHSGQTDTLRLGESIWYEGNVPVDRDEETDWVLYVRDALGREATATTRFLPIVDLDSLSYNRDSANKARILLYWNDPIGLGDQYRITAVGEDSENNYSIEIDDALFDGQQATWPTKAKFKREWVKVRLYHIDDDYFRFLTSVWNAGLSTDGPLSEPTEIYTNVQGGLGIFTALNFSELSIRTRN